MLKKMYMKMEDKETPTIVKPVVDKPDTNGKSSPVNDVKEEIVKQKDDDPDREDGEIEG